MARGTGSKPKSIELLSRIRYLTATVLDEEGEPTKVRFDILKELRVSEASLGRILEQHSKQVFYWQHARARLISEVRKRERELAKMESRLWLSYRYKKDEDGDRYTDQYLTHLVRIDDRYMDLKEALDDVKDQLSTVQSVCDAFEHRRFMIAHKHRDISSES